VVAHRGIGQSEVNTMTKQNNTLSPLSVNESIQLNLFDVISVVPAKYHFNNPANKKIYFSFQRYEVTDVSTVNEFFLKYMKKDRYAGYGEEYTTAHCQWAEEQLREFGYVIISHHSSITGEIVSFYNQDRIYAEAVRND
jgi:hypothetical protein